MAIATLIRELRRRRVFRLAGIYLIGAWLLLQVADVTFAPIGLPTWAMPALVWIVVAGFPIALVLGWRYDLTDEGLIRTKPASRSGDIDLSLRRVDYVILAGVLVIAAFTALAVIGQIREQGDRKSILPELPLRADTVAVLPFANLSNAADDKYFSDGIAEEIRNELARGSPLKVIARTSSFAIEDQGMDVREIAQRLGARNVVEGSVRRSGDRLRISAQLIDAPSGTQLWSHSYDIQTIEIFDVQQDIARQIVVAIGAELDLPTYEPSGGVPMTSSIEAYDHYLLGNHYYWQRGKEPVEKAIAEFRQALALDDEFAHAWAALAAAYNSALAHGAELGDADPWALADAAAERAVELDDNLGLAWMVLGNVRGARHGDLERGAQYLTRAQATSPNEPTVVHWLTEAMSSVGRVREAMEYARKGYEMDPAVPLRSVMLGCTSMLSGQYRRGLRFIDHARQQGFADRLTWSCGLWGTIAGDEPEAVADWLERKPFEDSHAAILAEQSYMLAYSKPSAASVERAVAEILNAYGSHEDAPRIDSGRALVYLVSLGAIDAAYEVMDRRHALGAALPLREWWLPEFSAFRRDPRFIELAEKSGLPGFWRAYGWPDACQPSGVSFVCE